MPRSRRLVDTECERGAQTVDRLVERERGGGRLGREQVVRDGPLDDRRPALPRRSGARAPRAVPRASPAAGLVLERVRHPRVQLGAAWRRHAVEDRPAHQLVGEAVGEAPPRRLRHETAPHRLVHRVEQAAFVEARRATDGVQLERGADRRAELEHDRRSSGPSRASLCLTTSRTVSGVPMVDDRPRQAHGGGPHLERVGVDELPPQLREQEGVPVREAAIASVTSRAGLRAAWRDGRTPATSSSSEPAETQTRRPPPSASDRRESPQSAVDTSASASRKVATSSSRASAPARTRCRRRSRVGASAQCTSSSTSSTGDRSLTAVSRSVTAVCRR